jgi:hypothetical protein
MDVLALFNLLPPPLFFPFLMWECTSLNCIRFSFLNGYAVTVSHFNHRLKLSDVVVHLCVVNLSFHLLICYLSISNLGNLHHWNVSGSSTVCSVVSYLNNDQICLCCYTSLHASAIYLFATSSLYNLLRNLRPCSYSWHQVLIFHINNLLLTHLWSSSYNIC